jgi:hypothetical protein
MATVVKTFNYTGTLQQATIPPGTQSMDVHLWGGAGGGGGGDRAGPGASGSAGHYVTSTSIAISSAQIGTTINVAVGGGGGGGSGGGNAPGGVNGKSITGYSGGIGGNSGPSGSSGAGGGATVVQIDSTDIAVAGGGGGGGGAGIASNGTAGINTNSATANSPGTLGEDGKDHTGDGGGGGAGGGGVDGGRSGNGGSGDNGGTGGYAGSNNAAGGSESNGSGITPGGTGSQYYTSGVAVAGGPGSSGADGKAVVVFNIGVQAQTKVGNNIQSFSRSLNSTGEIVTFFNNLVNGIPNPGYQHAWWVVSPALTQSQWQGIPYYYNNSIFIVQGNVTRYTGTNSSDTSITVNNTTYTRTGSPAGGNVLINFVDGSSQTYNIQIYSFSTTQSAGWRSIDRIFTKVSGSWKQITSAYMKVGGAWKALFNSGISFIETAAGFGDSSGSSSSGSGGTGGGGGCFIAGTMVTMADGTQKPVEQVDIGDTVSVGGKVFATGKFLIDNLYDYKGIQVSGTHMVKEDGKWTRVEDSRLGRSLGDDEVIVYVFGNENRRIIINDTEFTDYFELSEQQELANHGEQFFSNWQDHDRQIHDKNVNILNA